MSSVMLFLESARTGKLDLSDTSELFNAALDNASMCVLKEERALVAHLDLKDI